VCGKRHYQRNLPSGKNRYRLCRRLGGPLGRAGRVRKISPPLEFDPWTVQSVESRCTDQLITLILFRTCPITPSNERNNSVVTAVFVTYIKYIDKDNIVQDTQLVRTVIHKSLNVRERPFPVLQVQAGSQGRRMCSK